MPDDLLTPGEVAARLGVSLRTLWRRRADGTLPPPVKSGPAGTFWKASDLPASLEPKPLGRKPWFNSPAYWAERKQWRAEWDREWGREWDRMSRTWVNADEASRLLGIDPELLAAWVAAGLIKRPNADGQWTEADIHCCKAGLEQLRRVWQRLQARLERLKGGSHVEQ
jgi:predicted DNA-binding transcriptional regulator AlpA